MYMSSFRGTKIIITFAEVEGFDCLQPHLKNAKM